MGRSTSPTVSGLGIEIDMERLEAAHELHQKLGLERRDDTAAMQYLVPGWTFASQASLSFHPVNSRSANESWYIVGPNAHTQRTSWGPRVLFLDRVALAHLRSPWVTPIGLARKDAAAENPDVLAEVEWQIQVVKSAPSSAPLFAIQ